MISFNWIHALLVLAAAYTSINWLEDLIIGVAKSFKGENVRIVHIWVIISWTVLFLFW